ncbi:MAG TPA: ABC transporter permease [Methylomirabilota bacterium]|nr:ABC transporter permease [Methylomirabilota bacterium]
MKPVAREWQLVLPLALFFVVFVFAPLGLLGIVSFYNDSGITTPGVAQYVKFLTDRFNMAVLGQTLWLGLLATAMALLIGYPLAYVYMVAPAAVQRVLMLAIVLPLLTSAVVRTFAWVVILGRQGIVNSMLAAIGLIDAPVRLLYTPSAVVVALAQIQLPLMVLPVITALGNIDPNLRHASHALGAGRWSTFIEVTLPLSAPGLLAGCLLVYAGSVSAFVTQTLVGGGQLMLMPQYMYQQAIQANNYPFAAAVAMILLAAVLAIVIVVSVVSRRTETLAHG